MATAECSESTCGRATPDFAQLYEELHPRLLATARSWAPPGTAEDVVQETWAAAVSGWDRFEGRSMASTWVFGILRRQSARRWRDRERRHVRLGESLGDDAQFDSRVADETAWSDPPRLVETRIATEALLNIVKVLPSRYRTIITLRDLEGLTAQEAEDALKLSSGNQRVLLHRARHRVQLEFERRGLHAA